MKLLLLNVLVLFSLFKPYACKTSTSCISSKKNNCKTDLRINCLIKDGPLAGQKCDELLSGNGIDTASCPSKVGYFFEICNTAADFSIVLDEKKTSMKVSKEDITPAFVFDGVLQPEKCIVYEHEASLSQCGLIPAASLRIRGNMLVTYEKSKSRKNKGNKGKGKYGKGQKITRCSCKTTYPEIIVKYSEEEKSTSKKSKAGKSCKAAKSVKSSKSSECFQDNPITQLNFNGVKEFKSFKKGSIELLWEEPLVCDPSSVIYHIFIAPSDFDFSDIVTNDENTFHESICTFEEEPTNMYVASEDSSSRKIDLPDGMVSLPLSALIVAEIPQLNLFSENNISQYIYVSKVNPTLHQNTTFIGLFVPTNNLKIKYEDDTLEFEGALTNEHKELQENYSLSVITSNGESVLMRVTEVIEKGDQLASFEVTRTTIFEVLKELDFASHSAIPNYSEINQEEFALTGIGDFFSDVDLSVDSIVEGATAIVDAIPVKIVGDVITTAIDVVKECIGGIEKCKARVQEIIEHALDVLEKGKTFTIFEQGFNKTFDIGDSLKLAVAPKQHMYLDASANIVKKEVKGSVTYEGGCDYILKADKVMGEDNFGKNMTVYQGPKVYKVFFVGPFPVEVDYQVKFDIEMEARLEVETPSFEYKMGWNAVWGIDAKAKFGSTPSDWDFGVSLPSLKEQSSYVEQNFEEGKVSVYFSISLIVRVDVNLYEGILSSDLGVKIKPDLNSTLIILDLKDECFSTSDEKLEGAVTLAQFDSFLDITAPVELSSKWLNNICTGKWDPCVLLQKIGLDFEWLEEKCTASADDYKKVLCLCDGQNCEAKSFFNKEFDVYGKMIVSLPPTPDLDVGHTCARQVDNINKAQIAITATEKDDDNLVRNSLDESSTKWFVQNDLKDDWIDSGSDGSFKLVLSKDVGQVTSSPPQNGLVCALIEPKIPPLGIPVLYREEISLQEVECQ